MIKYPNGPTFVEVEKEKKVKNAKRSFSSANRGMNFEDDINESNDWYRLHDMCIITKRPTPINIVKVDYSHGARITDAYFEKQSTTDYNGVYKGRYIDFEAKNTKNKTAFPLNNIYVHQINHLKMVIKHGGIAFFLIQFQTLDLVYLLDASFVISFFEERSRASIPLSLIQEKGIEVKRGYAPRLDYLPAIEKEYFN